MEWDNFKVPPQIPGRKSVDGVGSDGVGHAKHAREDSPDVSPGFGFNRPRHPERTVLYRVLFHHFERFVAEYEGLVVASWVNYSNRGKGYIGRVTRRGGKETARRKSLRASQSQIALSSEGKNDVTDF